MIEAVDQFVLPLIDSLYGRFGYLGVVIAMTIESAAIPSDPPTRSNDFGCPISGD